jgi:uncharacterized membrane protein
MTKEEFLRALRLRLAGLRPNEVDEIIDDYTAYFADSAASGRDDSQVVASLGDPIELARALRAETEFQRLDQHWNLSNLLTATLALVGLALFDVVFLIPLLVLTLLITLIVAAAFVAVGALGLKVVAATLVFDLGSEPISILARLLFGVGLISGFAGGCALLLLCFGASVRALINYGRMHSRLSRPFITSVKHPARVL